MSMSRADAEEALWREGLQIQRLEPRLGDSSAIDQYRMSSSLKSRQNVAQRTSRQQSIRSADHNTGLRSEPQITSHSPYLHQQHQQHPFCSSPESSTGPDDFAERNNNQYMYENGAGGHTGTTRLATQDDIHSTQFDDRSRSSRSSGIKRSASPASYHHPNKRRSDYGKPPLPKAVERDKPPPSAWISSPQGILQRYPVQRESTGDSFVAPVFDKNRVDSGYESRQNTLQTQQSWQSVPPVCNLLAEPALDSTTVKQEYPHFPTSPRQPEWNMMRQPPRSLITQEQLAAEVKGIYAGLVMVEAKSINIDAEQAADRTRKLTPEQWQSLIALRRTLLYEHHDFLMATQHPTANAALRGLAAKYCMPARMWKHGIHGFLEVLRHRRPESQEYMLTFIYLAYDMMALLFETVPAFTDTWIECLGDLARYRMAIEENKEVHAIWGGVAGRWYTMASDRHPQIGRLYHHLGILERPSLRKLYFYSRSLTSVVPFINARESLGTLCAPILQDDQAIRCGPHGAEAMTICYHARVFSNLKQDLLERDGQEALKLLKDQPAGKIASYAAPLAVTNIASLFEFGMPNNIFRQMFSAELARAAHNARPSTTSVTMSEAARAITESEAFIMTTVPSDFVIDFMTQCFNNLIRRELNHSTIRDLLQYVHVNIVFFSALLDLRTGLTLDSHIKMVDRILHAIDWACLAIFLNELASIDPISRRVEEAAAANAFLLPEKSHERRPLAEDFMIRGIIWAEGYAAADLFQDLEDDDGSRVLETPARLHLRAERVEWLACCVAQPSKHAPLVYDFNTKKFHAQSVEGSVIGEHLTHTMAIDDRSNTVSHSPEDSSTTMSRQSSLVEDYDMLSMDVKSQRAPSEATYPSKTDGSYVSVSSARSSKASPNKRRASRLKHSMTETSSPSIVDIEAEYGSIR